MTCLLYTSWNGIKNVFNGIKDTVSNAWGKVKETAANVWNGIKNTVSTKLNNIKKDVYKRQAINKLCLCV